jgi:hypothetical protein
MTGKQPNQIMILTIDIQYMDHFFGPEPNAFRSAVKELARSTLDACGGVIVRPTHCLCPTPIKPTFCFEEPGDFSGWDAMVRELDAMNNKRDAEDTDEFYKWLERGCTRE